MAIRNDCYGQGDSRGHQRSLEFATADWRGARARRAPDRVYRCFFGRAIPPSEAKSTVVEPPATPPAAVEPAAAPTETTPPPPVTASKPDIRANNGGALPASATAPTAVVAKPDKAARGIEPAEDAGLRAARAKLDAKLYDQALTDLKAITANAASTNAAEAQLLVGTIYERQGVPTMRWRPISNCEAATRRVRWRRMRRSGWPS